MARTSTGLLTVASGYNFSFKRLLVFSERGGSSSPSATSISVAITAGPPVFVIIPTRFPFGMGWVAKAAAAWISSPSSLKVRMPAFLNIRSVAISSFASPPVWEAAALAPSLVRPAFMARTGFLAATSLATFMNVSGSLRPST